MVSVLFSFEHIANISETHSQNGLHRASSTTFWIVLSTCGHKVVLSDELLDQCNFNVFYKHFDDFCRSGQEKYLYFFRIVSQEQRIIVEVVTHGGRKDKTNRIVTS